MEEWEVFMMATIYAPRCRNKSKQVSKQEPQITRYDWCGGRERLKGEDDCGEGESTTALGMEKRHSKWDGKPQGLALQGEKTCPDTYRFSYSSSC